MKNQCKSMTIVCACLAFTSAADACPGDFDESGSIGASDLAQLLGAWGPNPGHIADLTSDGMVNAADLAQLLGAWGPCASEGPVIFGHSPYLIETGTAVTVNGDGFPLDTADIDVYFLSEDGNQIGVLVDDVIDLDDDGDGDVISGTVENTFASDDGQILTLSFQEHDGQDVESFGQFDVLQFAYLNEDDAQAPSPNVSEADDETEEYAPERGRKYGSHVPDQDDDGPDGEDDVEDPEDNKNVVEFDDLPWESGETFVVSIKYYIRYKSGGSTSATLGYPSVSTMTAGESPSAEECLDAIVAKMNAMLDLCQDGGQSTVAFQNFEWQRNGTSVELVKREDAPDGDTHLIESGSNKKDKIEWKKQ